MKDAFNRRDFIKRTAIGCAGVTAVTGGALLASDKGRNEPRVTQKVTQVRDFSLKGNSAKPLLVISRGEPEKAVRAAIKALGGMGKFISKGDSVVIKPNVGWDRTPVQAGNTNPVVVKTLVELCFEAHAKKVIITDNTCNDPARCFTRSGIWKMAEAAGAEIVLPAEHRFRDFDIGGQILGRMPVLVPAVEADKFINVPIAKHHGLSKFTGAMKNLYGVLGGRRNRLHQRIDDSIADLADFIRPTLTLMDATRVLLRNGPQGGNIADTKEVGEIIASTDQVAVDAYSCGLIGLTPKDLPYLALAEKRGLGTANLKKVDIKEVS